jgi:hypothetical protein
MVGIYIVQFGAINHSVDPVLLIWGIIDFHLHLTTERILPSEKVNQSTSLVDVILIGS